MNLLNPVANRCYKLSAWGQQHKLPARVILTLSHTLLTGIFLLSGALLISYSGSGLPLLQLLLLLIAGGIVVIYGRKKGLKGRAGWAIRKKGEGAFLLCGFLLLLLTGPALRDDRISFGATPAFASATTAPAAVKKQTKAGRFLKKLAGKYRDMSTGGKVALTIAIVLLALILGIGVLALGCSLSCNGAQTAGTLVMVFGLVGVGVLAGYAIRQVYRN